ncbi:MAG: polyketide cyclase, partial [Chloroflexota bacterium]
LPYRLTFDMQTTRIEPLLALEGIASGELEGTGRWRFSTDGPLTIVHYDWQVHTTKRWMNWLAPLAGPIFRWNHDVVMRQGGHGLARLLDARLVNVGTVESH